MSEEVFQFLDTNPQFISDINPDLRCKLCTKVMIKASYLPCYCEFCYKCIHDYLQSGNTNCPVANEECCNVTVRLEDITENPPVINKINKLLVKCPNQNCYYQGTVCNMVHHLETCVMNPLVEFQYETDELDDHGDEGKMLMIERNNFKMLTNFNKNLKKRFSQLEVDKVHLDNENKELKEKVNQQDWEMDRITKQNEMLKNKCKEMKRTNNEVENREIKKIIREFNAQSNLMKYENVEGKMEVELRNFSPFNWIVEGIEEKRKGRGAFWSPAFYSDEAGYKMQVEIQFKGPCSPVGFYGRILVGVNDANLIWPCTKSIRLKVVGGKVYNKCLVKFHGPSACRPGSVENPARWGDMIKASDFYSAMKNNQIWIICQVV